MTRELIEKMKYLIFRCAKDGSPSASLWCGGSIWLASQSICVISVIHEKALPDLEIWQRLACNVFVLCGLSPQSFSRE